MNEQTETGTAIALPQGTSLEAMLTTDKGLDPILDQIEAEVRAEPIDLTTPKGRKAVASLAYRVSQSKAALDAAGKAMNEDARKKIDLVDAQRRAARDRLDKLRDEVRAPLTAWEEAEEERIASHRRALASFNISRTSATDSVDAIRHVIDDVTTTIQCRGFQEFQEEANEAFDLAQEKYGADLQAAQEREAREEELAELRAREEARRIADEQAAAQAEADRLERERVQREAEELEERKRQEKARQEREEREAKERAEANRISLVKGLKKGIEDLRKGMIGGQPYPAIILLRDLEERIPLDFPACGADAAELDHLRLEAIAEIKAAVKEQAEAAEIKRKREIAQTEEAARKAERDRIAEEERKAKADQEKREANKRHVKKIRDQIAAALLDYHLEDLAQAIIDGKIPHVKAIM